MCCTPTYFTKEQIDGECSECGCATVDGQAYESCEYSPTICETCGSSPCDGSC
jgi:hypothetical protein